MTSSRLHRGALGNSATVSADARCSRSHEDLGDPEAQSSAQRLLAGGSGDDIEVSFRLLSPKNRTGHIIGPKGAQVQRIRKEMVHSFGWRWLREL
jgi:hypothetical protein